MPHDPFPKHAKRHLKAQPGEPHKPAKRRTSGPYSIESRRRRHNRSGDSSTTDSSGSQQGMFDSAQDVSVSGGTFNNLTRGSLVVNIHQQSGPSRAESSFADASRSLQMDSLRQHENVIERSSHTKTEFRNAPVALPSTRRPRPNISDSRIYHDQLLPKGRGTPLWHPSPNRRLPKNYRRIGITIGDVGTINEFGAFCFLFNIFEEALSEVNGGLVPTGFQPLRWIASTEPGGTGADNVGVDLRDVEEQRVYDDGSWLGTGAIEEVVESSEGGHTFRTRACEGAILTMPFGSTSKDLVNRQLLQDYMATNLEEWYIYANCKRGRQARNGDIRLVYGCDKVSSWGIATFHHEQIMFGDTGPDRTLRFVPIKSEHRATTGSLTKFAWGVLSGGSGRAGPSDQEIRDLVNQPDTMEGLTGLLDAPIENQCVFIRTLNAMLREEDWARTLSGSSQASRGSGSGSQQPHNPPGGNGHYGGNHGGHPRSDSSDPSSQYTFGPAAGVQYTMMDGQPMPLLHPSESLNRLLLQRFPGSRMVVTADADWLAVLESMQSLAWQNGALFDDQRFFKLGNQGVLQLKTIQPESQKQHHYQRRLQQHTSFFSKQGDLLVIARHTAFRLHRRHLNTPLKSFISTYAMARSRRRIILNGMFADQFEDLLARHYQPHSVTHGVVVQEAMKKEEDLPIDFFLAKSELAEPARKSSPLQTTDLKNAHLPFPIEELPDPLSEPQSLPLELETWFDIALSIGVHDRDHRRKRGSVDGFLASQSRAASSQIAVSFRPSHELRAPRTPAMDFNLTGWSAETLKHSACLLCRFLHKKCDFTPGSSTCKRCAKGGPVCITVGSSSRKAPRQPGIYTSKYHSNTFTSKLHVHQFAAELPPSLVSRVSLPLGTGQAHYRKPSSIYSLLTSNKRPREQASGDDSGTATFSLCEPSPNVKRLRGACARCQGLKVRCIFTDETGPCQRCFNASRECVIPGRKPRAVPPRREHLIAQIQSQSTEIEKLRNELAKVRLGLSVGHSYSEQERRPVSKKYAVSCDQPVDVDQAVTPSHIQSEEDTSPLDQHHSEETPTTVVASVSSQKPSGTPKDEVQKDTVNEDSSIANTQLQLPTLLMLSLVSPQEVEKLFNIYFTFINPSISLLDPNLCTVPRTLSRSPFLFTVVCAVASKFENHKPQLYHYAMHYAQLAAGTALINGEKNLEMCQAYLLLSLYCDSPRKTEEESTWLYLGLAIRIATDLNLHLPNMITPMNEMHGRELANRARVWLNCFNLDRSVCLRYGKPFMISSNDYSACHSENWWHSSPREMRDADILLCANVAKWNLLDSFLVKLHQDSDNPTQLNLEYDLGAYAITADDDLQLMSGKWTNTLEVNSNMSEPKNSFREVWLRLTFGHARLVALSYVFQQSLDRNDGVSPLLRRSLSAAFDVVSAVDHIYTSSQNQYWEYGPESLTLLATFATAFLVKVLQSSLVMILSQEERGHILEQTQAVIDLLDAPGTNTVKRPETERHSQFLRELAETLSTFDFLPQKPKNTWSFPSLSKTVTDYQSLSAFDSFAGMGSFIRSSQ